MKKKIFSPSLSIKEFHNLERIFQMQKASVLAPWDVEDLDRAHRQSVPIDLEGRAYLVFTIAHNDTNYEIIKLIQDDEIRIETNIIDEIKGNFLKARLHSEFMMPTVKSGDIGYFVNVDAQRSIMWGDVYLLESEDDTWLCRVGQSDSPDKLKLYYDGNDVSQEVPRSHFKSIWQLKQLDRWISQTERLD